MMFFSIWTHGKENLLKFIQEINSYYAIIKFTAEWSREFVVFLDTTVICDGRKLITSLHQSYGHPTVPASTKLPSLSL